MCRTRNTAYTPDSRSAFPFPAQPIPSTRRPNALPLTKTLVAIRTDNPNFLLVLYEASHEPRVSATLCCALQWINLRLGPSSHLHPRPSYVQHTLGGKGVSARRRVFYFMNRAVIRNKTTETNYWFLIWSIDQLRETKSKDGFSAFCLRQRRQTEQTLDMHPHRKRGHREGIWGS